MLIYKGYDLLLKDIRLIFSADFRGFPGGKRRSVRSDTGPDQIQQLSIFYQK